MQIKVVLRADVYGETYDKVAVISGMDSTIAVISSFPFPIIYIGLEILVILNGMINHSLCSCSVVKLIDAIYRFNLSNCPNV